MENELAEIKTSIQERGKGIFIIPAIASTCAVIIFFINSYLLIAGLFVIIIFCLFLYANYFQLSKIAKNIHFNSPEGKDEIDTVFKLIQKEKTITVNVIPYIILYTGLVLCRAGIENTPFKLIEFAVIQFVVFALIYIDQLNKKGRKYASLLEKLEMLSCK
ncbi:hypothetical protein [Dyadobacter frigoris]|uniref:Uncharacterized protein n=1 Tax=Dyadobacter frigoris TaxID=2576211 RepID=A0A4U6DBE9_9BACT|nr:hypothetical protein [Dyadobacter frigoris]TKT94085.1 hypothetical protein FDK13_02425 [Dyadobacter frigoris]GLU50705.1 hypothetical protein Dfri01_01660 [Dyadobacter frigoris]